MSFILDALKKSENERQRQIGPSLADVPISRRHSDKPWWAVAVGALLVVNLGVLLIVLMRDGDANPAAPQPAQNSPAPAAAATTSTQVATQQYGGTQIPDNQMPRAGQSVTVQVSPAVRSLADEAGGFDTGAVADGRDPYLASAAAIPEGPPLVRPIEAPTVAPAPARAVFESRAAQNATTAQTNEVLPTLNDLTASGTSLPQLHLDIHVSSANAAERFVFVNMRKYVEGQSLNEGPAVERITAEGVVLNHRGLRFLLPRQ